MRGSRKPEIMSDAAHAIFLSDARTNTGRFLIDDDVLAEAGVKDFSAYRHDPSAPLFIDIFVDPEQPHPDEDAVFVKP